MSVSLVESVLMTSHREFFPVVASLKKLSITPRDYNHHVKPTTQGEDMVTDKDEPPAKPLPQAEVSWLHALAWLACNGS